MTPVTYFSPYLFRWNNAPDWHMMRRSNKMVKETIPAVDSGASRLSPEDEKRPRFFRRWARRVTSALRRTTEEILSDPAAERLLAAEARTFLRRVLEAADRAKFSGRAPNEAAWEESLRAAERLLEAVPEPALPPEGSPPSPSSPPGEPGERRAGP